MRIDAHHHVWDLAVRDQPWTAGMPALRRTLGFDDLVPSLDRHDIDGTILVQTVADAGETRELLALARERPRIFGVVGWADLTEPDVAGHLPLDSRLVGLRHQVGEESDPRWLLRADVRRGLTAVADAGLAFDLVVTADQLPAVAEVVRRHPRLRFVLDHAGKPPIAAGRLDPWRGDLAAVAALPNVACKLSGLVTEDIEAWSVERLRPYVDHVLAVFGARRVMVGSDWPVLLMRTGYDGWMDTVERFTAGLAPADRAAVFGGTAAKWYGPLWMRP